MRRAGDRRAAAGETRPARSRLGLVGLTLAVLLVACQGGLPGSADPLGAARLAERTASPDDGSRKADRVLQAARPDPEGDLRAGPSPTRAPRPTPWPVAPRLAAALQAQLGRAFQGEDVPGISLAVILGDGSTWAGTSGVAALDTGAPLTTDTMFNVASITKPFIAAVIMQLAEEGRLSLDDRLSEWLVGFPHGDRITIRQLLNHTSGVRDYFADDAALIPALLADPERRWTPADVLEYVGAPYWQPGGGWRYSNTNYLLLGLVIQRATGGSVGEELRARFLDPLELTNTFLQPDEKPSGLLADGHTRAYDDDGDGFPDSTTKGGPYRPDTAWASSVWTAGAMVSTPSDLARWADALFRGRVLEEESLEEMVRFNSDDYGLGVQLERISGHLSWGHSGLLRGYTGLMLHYPADDVTVVLLTNQDRVPVEEILKDRYGGSQSLLELALNASD